MARDWKKFTFDELVYIWGGHKLRNPEIDPLRIQVRADHKRIELTKEDMEDLIDHLLIKIYEARRTLGEHNG